MMVGNTVKFRRFGLTFYGVVKSYSMDDSQRVTSLMVRCKLCNFRIYPEDVIFIGG